MRKWCLPCSRFFSICACSARVREWKDRVGSPGLTPGIFSTSNCCFIVWYSLRLAGTEEQNKNIDHEVIQRTTLIKSQSYSCSSLFFIVKLNLMLVRKILIYIMLTKFSPPCPVHDPLASCSRFVEVTCSTSCFIHHRWRLMTGKHTHTFMKHFSLKRQDPC